MGLFNSVLMPGWIAGLRLTKFVIKKFREGGKLGGSSPLAKARVGARRGGEGDRLTAVSSF
jgi:hypothetical protein